MALDLPETAAEISTRAKTDVRRELENSDPFLRRSWLGAIISSICNRIFEFYAALKESELEGNPKTAVRTLPLWASAHGLFFLPGAPAAGQAFLNASSGGSGTLIPAGTRIVSSNGSIYVTTGNVTIATFSKAIASITYSGLTATVTTSVAHGLASNAIVTISGANESAYNLASVPINVLSETSFTYDLLTTPSASPATGTIVAGGTGATLTVNSEEAGVAFNLDFDTEIAFETPIAGVETTAQVVPPGVVDGTDLETTEALRARLLDRIQNPVANFNRAQIRALALGVSGVTRVFVQEATPAAGQVTVYFMRDLDASPIPSASEVATVKAAILTKKPASTSDSDVIVSAPTEVSTDFVFTALSPNTASMQAAIAQQLADFFANVADVGVSIVQDAYRSAIYNTLDPVTGQRVSSFTLSAPSGTITIASGEIATLGAVSF